MKTDLLPRFLAALTVVLLLFASARAVEEKAEDGAKILFIGLHDRELPALAEVVKETGILVDKQPGVSSSTPERVMKEIERRDYARYDLVYILQINPIEASLLSDWLAEAKKENPKLRVVALDYRDTHQELLAEGILEKDEKVREYWREFAQENLKRLLIYSNVRYLGAEGEILPPIPVPSEGLYHPDAAGYFTAWPEYLAWYRDSGHFTEGAPFVSTVVQQDYTVWAGASAIYDAVIREMEKNGINIAPVFGGQKYLQDLLMDVRPSLLMLQHHSGPEDSPPAGEASFLERLGVPYLYTAGYLGSCSIEEWKADVRGIRPGSGYNQLHRHEYHGIIEPMLAGAREPTGLGYAIEQPIPERVARIAGRVKAWLNLQKTPPAEKKVAHAIHQMIGISVVVKLVEPRTVARSEGKAKRVIDNRKLN